MRFARTRDGLSAQAEAKNGLKAELESEVGAAEDETALNALRAKFSERERALEHKIGARVRRLRLWWRPHDRRPDCLMLLLRRSRGAHVQRCN